MQRAGEKFLAHARLPGDEHVDVAGGGFLKFREGFVQGRAVPDDVGVQQQTAGLLVPAGPPLSGLRERLRQIARAQGLDQIFPRARAQGRFGGVGVAVPGDDDDVRASRELREGVHVGQPVAVREQDVQKHDVHARAGQHKTFLDARRLQHLMAE